MEFKSIVICNICNKSMNDSRILKCSHSFCLKCIESLLTSKESSKCPTCQIRFKIPKGGPKDLKKNEFIERLKSLTEFFTDYSRGYSLENLNSMQSNVYAMCVDHVDVMNLFCKTCNVVICGHCLLGHNNHNVVPVKELFDYAKNDLERHVKMKEEVLRNVMSNSESLENLIYENEKKATDLKLQIDQRGEYVKKIVDSIVDELMTNVDEEFKRCDVKANSIMLHLKDMETSLHVQIETLKQQIMNLKYTNFLESSQIDDKIEKIPNHSKPFNLSLVFNINVKENGLEKMIGTLFKEPKIRIAEEEKLNEVKSFSLNGDEVFVAYCNEPKIEVFNIDDFTSKSTFHIGTKLSKVIDLLSIDETLFVLGRNDDDGLIVKIDNLFEHEPIEIFKLSNRADDAMFSKSCYENILFIVSDKLIHLSENGMVLHEINLKFRIFDALQISKNSYVVSHFGYVCMIDDNGNVKSKYMPIKCHQAVLPYRLAVNNYNNIFVSNSINKIFVFDCDLNCLSAYFVNKHLCKISCNKVKDEILAVTDLGKLTIIEI